MTNSNKISTKKRAGIFGLMYGAIVVGFLTLSSFAAGSATLTLSPSSGSYAVNTNFTVTITQNSGADPINVADVYLTYDAAKLQYVSTSSTNSAYDASGASTGGGGNVHILRYNGDGSTETGSREVSRVTFKVLAGSGTGSISFGASSALYRATDNAEVWTGSTAGGTYTFTTPTPPPPPPATNNNTTSNNNNNATTSNTSSRTTSNSSTDTNPDNNSPTNTTTNNNTSQPDSSTPETETPYTEDGAVGYILAIKVLNGDEPVVDATVELDGRTAVTDATGVAGFIGIPEGEYEVKVVSDGSEVLSKINVSAEGESTAVQEFEVQLQKTNFFVLLIIPVLVIGALIAVKLVKHGSGTNNSDDYFVGTVNSEPVDKVVDTSKPLIDKVAGVTVPVAGETIYPKANKDSSE